MSKSALLLLIFLPLAACSGEVYLRNGVTDGDTFYLSPRALADDDPALQSWVRYSLALSTCQLREPSPNPARNTSFRCERKARRHLLEAWREHRAATRIVADPYLDALLAVDEAGWLDEYVAHYLADPHWRLPERLEVGDFRSWQRRHLPGHRPETRLTGSWNYAHSVRSAQ